MTSSFFSSQSSSSASKTHYDILQISPTASPLDIKKAYRRLALEYHPDRNSDPNATQLFQQVGEAYACLSDPNQRRDYDRHLQQVQQQQQDRHHVPGDSTNSTASPSSPPFTYYHYHPRNPIVIDPWTQFDFLFHNDPFFQDYFENPEVLQQELDDWQQTATTIPITTPNNNRNVNARNTSSSSSAPRIQQEGWIPWLLRQCGIQFTMTTIVQDGNGRIHAKQVSSSSPSRTNPRHSNTNKDSRHHGSSSSSSSPKSTTIQQETVSYMENGLRVWIKRRQLQGALIEDKIVGTTLVERKINGVAIPLQQQHQQRSSTTMQRP